jgi:hypothetical protein
MLLSCNQQGNNVVILNYFKISQYYMELLTSNNICVSSKAFPSIASDTIVFTHYNVNLLQYDLSSGTTSRALTDAHRAWVLGPLNIFHHIFTGREADT